MAEPPLISVIIPVFDVAAYLPECLDSVLGQAGAEIEVIAVNDASSDASGQILDDRAAADPRLRVVHLDRNRGQGIARTKGLELASGEYVWFVDGDDRVTDSALAAIGARLAQSRPDVLLIDWVTSFPDGRTTPGPGTGLLAQVPRAGCTLADRPRLIDLTMTVWSKLLRREFLAGLGTSFGAGIHEDVPVTCGALLAAASIGTLPWVCYYYRQRPGSAMARSGHGHLAVLDSYREVFGQLDQLPVSDEVRTAVFERAIWHYTTVLDARSAQTPSTGGPTGLIPARARWTFFRRMHADFAARRPPGYTFPSGPRGMKFRLVATGNYPTYAVLARLNRLRVAAAARDRT